MKLNELIKVDDFDVKLIIDVDSIKESIQKLFNEFEEDSFLPFYCTENVDVLSKEQYDENVNDFLEGFEVLVNHPQLLQSHLKTAKKKKNGKLKKGSIIWETRCENSTYITDFTNTWIRARIKIRATAENEVTASFETMYDSPN